MTIQVNTIQLYADVDNSILITEPKNPTEKTITVWRDTTTNLSINCLVSYSNTTSYAFGNSDRYIMAVGNQYGNNSPVITSEDIVEGSGVLDINFNTTGNDLATDMGNAAAKTYSVQIWGVNDMDQAYLIVDGDMTIRNISVEIP